MVMKRPPPPKTPVRPSSAPGGLGFIPSMLIVFALLALVMVAVAWLGPDSCR
jgi:hypothetical protein